MNKSIQILSSCLLLAASGAHAERPAMMDTDTLKKSAAQTQPATTPPTPVMHEQVQGDIVNLPATELVPGETLPVTVLDFPRRGMSMDKVRNELGQPLSVSDAVGNPPITNWTYNDRVVYFEFSHVVHVVSR